MAISKLYHSDQYDSPVLSGTVDSICNLLYKCLVDGYNSLSVSNLSITSNEATLVTSTAHNLTVNCIILVSNANEALFNGEFIIKEIVDTTTIKYDLIGSNQTATGTITCKIAPAGWERAYDGSNKSVFRAYTGNRFYLRCEDSNAQYTTINVYETMSGIDTGQNGLTTLYWKKSDTSSSAARNWILIANHKTLYLFVQFITTSGYAFYGFGDFKSIKSNDLYNGFVMGHTNSTNNTIYDNITSYRMNGTTGYTGCILVRDCYDTVGGKIFTTTGYLKGSTGANYIGVSPSSAFLFLQSLNKMPLIKVDVLEVNSTTYCNVLRGTLPGLYNQILALGPPTFVPKTGYILYCNLFFYSINNKIYANVNNTHTTYKDNYFFEIGTEWTY